MPTTYGCDHLWGGEVVGRLPSDRGTSQLVEVLPNWLLRSVGACLHIAAGLALALSVLGGYLAVVEGEQALPWLKVKWRGGCS